MCLIKCLHLTDVMMTNMGNMSLFFLCFLFVHRGAKLTLCQCENVLEREVLSYIHALSSSDNTFQQDGTAVHTAQFARNC